jgi:3-dehydroquinate synthetase
MEEQLFLSSNLTEDLAGFLRKLSYDGLFILTDQNTEKFCLPLISSIPEIAGAKQFSIPAGEENKNTQTLISVWKFLSSNGANRQSILINLGGGMISDLGGMAAATFKRGIRFIQIPTTLLGAVDASIGGKTGVDFNGLKNEIGTFASALAVIPDASFFRTLAPADLLSGYAEMLKHALLKSEEDVNELLSFDLETIDYNKLNECIYKSIQIKKNIVRQDPQEKGLRKTLNLGHTFGHSFESLELENNTPVSHGYAVAWGLVCELYLSLAKLDFPKEWFSRLAYYIKEKYGKIALSCNQYEAIIERMLHDKKNDSEHIRFTLLRNIGEPSINQTASRALIEETLDFFREY